MISGQMGHSQTGKIAVDFAPPFPPGVGTAVTEGFHIGSYRGGNGRFFNGLIDEVGVGTAVGTGY